jgi:hypothetical protein
MGLFTNIFFSTTSNKNKNEVVVLMGRFEYDVDVIGEKNDQTALEVLFAPRVPAGIRRYETAWLVQDDKNPHDKNRVYVQIRGRQVGHLNPETAIQYRKHLESQGTPKADGQCQALIQGGWLSSDGRKGPYCVSLDLPTHQF